MHQFWYELLSPATLRSIWSLKMWCVPSWFILWTQYFILTNWFVQELHVKTTFERNSLNVWNTWFLLRKITLWANSDTRRRCYLILSFFKCSILYLTRYDLFILEKDQKLLSEYEIRDLRVFNWAHRIYEQIPDCLLFISYTADMCNIFDRLW